MADDSAEAAADKEKERAWRTHYAKLLRRGVRLYAVCLGEMGKSPRKPGQMQAMAIKLAAARLVLDLLEAGDEHLRHQCAARGMRRVLRVGELAAEMAGVSPRKLRDDRLRSAVMAEAKRNLRKMLRGLADPTPLPE